MELVIKIPEDYYNAIKEIPVEQSTADMLIIRNGTPLPKGHGELKDVNKFSYECSYSKKDDCARSHCNDCPYYTVSLADIQKAEVLVKADKGEE